MCSSIFHACLYCNKSHFIFFFFHCTELCSYIKIKILCKRTSLLYNTWVWLDYSCLTMALAITQHTRHGNGGEASKARYGYIIYNRCTITTRQCDIVPSVALLIKLLTIQWAHSAQQLLMIRKPWHMKQGKLTSMRLQHIYTRIQLVGVCAEVVYFSFVRVICIALLSAVKRCTSGQCLTVARSFYKTFLIKSTLWVLCNVSCIFSFMQHANKAPFYFQCTWHFQ